jgi:hypothetical protein
MANLDNWNYYYNTSNGEQHRANLVYTALVSPDKKTFCMKFSRDKNYHPFFEENIEWTEQLLTERFERELHIYSLAKTKIPIVDILDVNYNKREIYIKWPGDDFYMMGLQKSYEDIVPDWKSQIVDRYKEMWSLGLVKLSQHPNSWVVFDDGILRPWNWFFTFERSEEKKSISEFLIQISKPRQEKGIALLKKHGIQLEEKYDIWQLQDIFFESFRINYPNDLVDTLLKSKQEYN